MFGILKLADLLVCREHALILSSKALIFAFILCLPVSAQAESSIGLPKKIQDDETQLANWFAKRESIDPPYVFSISVGPRRDNLSWSIGSGGVDVASELNFSSLTNQISALANANIGNGWFIGTKYDTGAVRSGQNQDSDYAGNARTQGYSRSESETGGVIYDLSLYLAKRLHFLSQAAGGGLIVSPSIGLSIHQQSLTMFNAWQSVPFSAPMPELNNSYDARWKGFWAGIGVQLGLTENLVIASSYEFHRADYSAEANWNLRSDLEHPVSFRHSAKGGGKFLSFGVAYRISKSLFLSSTFERQSWNTNPGMDQTFFSYGTSSTYTLNPVKWDASAFMLGLHYLY